MVETFDKNGRQKSVGEECALGLDMATHVDESSGPTLSNRDARSTLLSVPTCFLVQ